MCIEIDPNALNALNQFSNVLAKVSLGGISGVTVKNLWEALFMGFFLTFSIGMMFAPIGAQDVKTKAEENFLLLSNFVMFGIIMMLMMKFVIIRMQQSSEASMHINSINVALAKAKNKRVEPL